MKKNPYLSRLRTAQTLRKLLLDIIVLIETAIIVALCGLSIHFGSRAYSEPSFIEISVDGTSLYIPDGRKLLEDWVPDDVLQERLLKTFIQGLRSVSQDEQENYETVSRAVYRSAGQANNVVMAYLNANPPVSRMKKETVKIPYENIELTRYDEHTWKIVWREITTSPQDENKIFSDKQYEAVVRTTYLTPSTENEKTMNPSGVYITYMDSDLLTNYM